jgi:signal recognition particle receptor subunit beta
MGARRTRKPKMIILFLNKFDLFSSQPPTDAATSSIQEQFKNDFASHIRSAELAAGKLGIKCPVIIGSALKNWNCKDLITTIGDTLYERQ